MQSIPAVIAIAFGCRRICLPMSLPRLVSALLGSDAGDHHAGGNGNQQRRDLRHQPVADRQDRVRLHRRRQADIPRMATPMTRPPTMLISVMTMPAMASPLTNFMAPSIGAVELRFARERFAARGAPRGSR